MKALILCGDGVNCENESSLALKEVGFLVDIIFINEFLKKKIKLLNYDLLLLPGGFSFADDLGSGKVYAMKLKEILEKESQSFLDKNGLIMGICNGFQILMELDFFSKNKSMTLSHNKQNQFINKWVEVRVNVKSKSPWLKGFSCKEFYLPIRHAEGNLLIFKEAEFDEDQIALSYIDDVNGSYKQIAGLVDDSGQVFGLMPHPEAAFRKEQIALNDKTIYGKQFFKNAYDYIKEKR